MFRQFDHFTLVLVAHDFLPALGFTAIALAFLTSHTLYQFTGSLTPSRQGITACTLSSPTNWTSTRKSGDPVHSTEYPILKGTRAHAHSYVHPPPQLGTHTFMPVLSVQPSLNLLHISATVLKKGGGPIFPDKISFFGNS
jgi:hypothetical protein